MKHALWMAIGLTLAVGCTKAKRDGENVKTPPAPELPALDKLVVKASIAAATLADDCATAELAADIPSPGAANIGLGSSGRAAGGVSAGAMAPCAGPNCPRFNRRVPSCEQSSLQLTLAAGPKGQRGTVELVKAELFDAATKAPLQTLVPREPKLWNPGTATYSSWDGAIEPGGNLQATWKLSAPDWTRIGGGSRLNAQGKSFLMKVTLRIADQETTIEKEVMSAELMVEGMIST